MPPLQKRVGYLIAVVSSVLVLLLRMALKDMLEEQARLMLFLVPVMLSGWWGGLGPGLLATGLSVSLGLYYIVPPDYSMRIETVADGLNAILFVVIGITISYLCEALHAARRRDTERQFQTLANSIPQIVWITRPDGHRFWSNNRYYEYTGTTPGTANGNSWQQVHDPAELPRVLKGWADALASGKPWQDTYPLRRSDGQMRWHLGRAVPVYNERGEIVYWFGTSTDIHDRIEVEQALKDADARKDQFLATLAHELRNPLTPLSNALELWPRMVNDLAEMENLRQIMARQVCQLVRLIDDLMDVSRISHGKVILRLQPLDVSDLIAAAVETVEPHLDSNGHQLTVALPDNPVFVRGDAARLTQVFSNILNNAVKYTGRNGIITVTVESQDNEVVINTRDNGPGIPVDMLTKIFEPFRQVDMTISRAHGGLGIGLMLAKQIVQLHGGSIEARSSGPGTGSEFIVTLPILVTMSQFPLHPKPDQESASTDSVLCHRILVVDDLPESADTLSKILRSLGQEAMAVNDGYAAIDWALLHHPEIIFLDIAMPGLDGYEVARRLREQPELSDLILVAVTGYGQHEDRKRSLQAGFNFHLTKPPNPNVLKNLLQNLPPGKIVAETVTS